ncbi:PKD domain-containing protein, partial [bacterium]|nr:PKD domain-containing protein [bacterium]
ISVVTDELGYFAIAGPEAACQAIEGCSPIVVAVGGTDIATGEVQENLLLVAEALLNETFAITPLSTLLAGSANPQAIIDALGLTTSADELLLIDPWLSTENSDPGAALLLSVNQQLALLMQSAASLLSSNSNIDVSQVNLALVAELEALLSGSQFDLADSQSLETLLQNSVERLQIEALISEQMSAAVALQVALINAILADTEMDLVGSLIAEILTLAQADLQNAIENLATEQLSLEQFAALLEVDSLFAEIDLPALLADLDNDDIPDLLDLDDDGDGVYDFIDAFPRDSAETLDTDGDGVGNNADSDDDNDGVADALDSFPTDASLTPPTAVIEASASTGYIFQRLSFDASDSSAGYQNDTITSYQWDFGDGSSATGVSASHAYNAAGNYQVSLSLENSDQLTASTTLDVVVDELGEFSVAGTISVPEAFAVDGDTNDSGATVVPNNSIATAQSLINPATVSGYVNTPNEGPNYDANGQSAELGDVDDYYRIDALGGEFISLTYADPDSTDLDLYLLDSNGDPAAASLGTSGYESLKIPSQPGIYYLQVTIWDVGASKYILELGLEEGIVTASADRSWSTNVDFAIGDIIVKEKSQFRSSATSSKGSLLTAAKTSAKQRRNSGAETSLYHYGEDIEGLAGRFDTVRKSPGVSRLLNQRVVKSAATTKVDDKIHRTRLKIATLLAAKQLSADASVLYAEPNYRRHKLDTLPNDRYYSDQDHYRSINLPAAWDITTGNADVKVAVIDTGIYEDHPDISLRLSNDGYDFIADVDSSGDGDGMDSDAN